MMFSLRIGLALGALLAFTDLTNALIFSSGCRIACGGDPNIESPTSALFSQRIEHPGETTMSSQLKKGLAVMLSASQLLFSGPLMMPAIASTGPVDPPGAIAPTDADKRAHRRAREDPASRGQAPARVLQPGGARGLDDAAEIEGERPRARRGLETEPEAGKLLLQQLMSALMKRRGARGVLQTKRVAGGAARARRDFRQARGRARAAAARASRRRASPLRKRCRST